jgi:Zn-dependent protease with chaperone function
VSATVPAVATAESPPATVRERLLAGPQSIRVPGERRTLVLCILAAPIVVGLVGTFFHGITVSEVALAVVVGLVFVSLSRGRLLGGSIRITEKQFPDVFREVEDLARRLGVRPPQVSLRDDPNVPVTSIGTEEPYALVISSQYFEHLSRGELRFLIARELGHIAAGHTRIASIFNASGRENPFVSIVFGSWLRKTEYTADRVGYLFSEHIGDAVNAIAITAFHAAGKRVNHDVLDEQRRELQEDSRLRLGEWSSATPFATNRIGALTTFAASAPASQWQLELAEAPLEAPALPEPAAAGNKVTRADCGSPVWRFVALLIDLVAVSAIVQSGLAFSTSELQGKIGNDKDLAWLVHIFPWLSHVSYKVEMVNTRTLAALLAYAIILVGLSGQTLGMMITELHVVDTRFRRAAAGRVVWRYLAALGCWIFVFPAFFGLFLKRQPHDWLSGTRVVRNQRIAQSPRGARKS